MLAVLLGLSLQEHKSALHTRGLISVHATSDQNIGFLGGPIFSLSGEERVALGVLWKRAVLCDVELVFHRHKLVEHLFLIRTLDFSGC